jgi:hypothetical protein
MTVDLVRVAYNNDPSNCLLDDTIERNSIFFVV